MGDSTKVGGGRILSAIAWFRKLPANSWGRGRSFSCYCSFAYSALPLIRYPKRSTTPLATSILAAFAPSELFSLPKNAMRVECRLPTVEAHGEALTSNREGRARLPDLWLTVSRR